MEVRRDSSGSYLWAAMDGNGNSGTLLYSAGIWSIEVNGVQIASVTPPTGGQAGTFAANLGVFNGLWELSGTGSRAPELGLRAC